MNRIVTTLFAAALVSACSQKTADEAPNAAGSAAANAAETTQAAQPIELAAATEPSAVATDTVTSRYTSLKSCAVVDDGGGEDWSVSRCKGLGGFDLVINYGDAREDIRVMRGGKKVADLNLVQRGGGGFNSVGENVEWRGSGEGAAFQPQALIIRNIVERDPERPNSRAELLEVFDLRQGCNLGTIEPRDSQNQAARMIADGAARTCQP